MQGLLQRHPDIDVLFSHNDSMTLGALEAIEEAGLAPGKDIIIITVDGEQAAIDLLKAGATTQVASELTQAYTEAKSLHASMEEYRETFEAQQDLSLLKQALDGGQINMIEYLFIAGVDARSSLDASFWPMLTGR